MFGEEKRRKWSRENFGAGQKAARDGGPCVEERKTAFESAGAAGERQRPRLFVLVSGRRATMEREQDQGEDTTLNTRMTKSIAHHPISPTRDLAANYPDKCAFRREQF